MIKTTTDCELLLSGREGAGADGGERSESLQGLLHQRDLLVQEKRRVEVISPDDL